MNKIIAPRHLVPGTSFVVDCFKLTRPNLIHFLTHAHSGVGLIHDCCNPLSQER
jgi:hypothetical protein